MTIMKKSLLTFFVALMACVLAKAGDLTTVFFTVEPPMSCENCENKIKKNIRFEKGVKEVEASAKNQIVTVKYDPEKINPDQLIKAFDKIGYKATVVPEGKVNKKAIKDSKSKKPSKCDEGTCHDHKE